MNTQKQFSLSSLFDEMKNRENIFNKKDNNPKEVNISSGISLLKELKNNAHKSLSLMSLARACKITISRCQNIANQLKSEGLVEIDIDDETGNDQIILTEKGKTLV